ncbi:MAG: Ig domain-containing protein, partial [Roseicyclus sp.]|nr:Ig domain-containing protein [Roseicyclus sp.]
VLDLALGTTAATTDTDATIGAFGLAYSTDGGTTWTSYSWTGSTGDRPPVPAGGTVLVRVDIATEADTVYEGPETFTLTATPVGGQAATGTGTIVDDGTGAIFGADGTEDSAAVKDDDRALSVEDVFVNEASPYAVFRVSAQGSQVFSLSLEDGPRDGETPTEQDARLGIDYGRPGASGPEDWGLQIFNGLTWDPYAAGQQVTVPDGGTVLLVRVPLINDEIYKEVHTFLLAATYEAEGVAQTVRGDGVIGDFGTGARFNDSGAWVSNPVLDDDRGLKVNSIKVNEGSSWAVFTVSGTPGQNLRFTVVQGSDPGSADLGGDPAVQVWAGSAWLAYDPDVGVSVPESGTVLVRVATDAEQDADREGPETFGLRVLGDLNQLSLSSEGLATIHDDGTGVTYPDADPVILSGIPSPVTDTADLDDDFDKDGIAPNVEEALATLSASQGKGGLGDLNGDGVPDAEQNAVGTLAWITREDFLAGMEGNLARVQPIVSVSVVSGAEGGAVDANAQLAAVEVLAYDDATGGGMPVPRASDVGARDLEVTWDPIRFAIEPARLSDTEAAEFAAMDVDPTRSGVQVRVYIDVENAGLLEGDLNAYLKYVSQEAIDAAGSEPLRDLEGRAIREPGWLDFTRKTDADGNPVGDGAAFVIEDGRIVGIELIITDNAFGDNDPTVGRVFDPGVPVRMERALPVQASAGVQGELEPIQHRIGPDLRPPGPPPAYVTYISEASRLGIADGFATTGTYWRDPLDPPWAEEDLPETGRDVLGAHEPMPVAEVSVPDTRDATITVDAAAGETRIEALDRHFDGVLSEDGRVYQARMADGGPLPAWIEIDPATGHLGVTAPAEVSGVIDIRVTVRDAAGREGVITVRIGSDQSRGALILDSGTATASASETRRVDEGLAEMLDVVTALSEQKATGATTPTSGFSATLAAMSAPSDLLRLPSE